MSDAKKPSTAKRIGVTVDGEDMADEAPSPVVITHRPMLKAPGTSTPEGAPPLPEEPSAGAAAKKGSVKSTVKPLKPIVADDPKPAETPAPTEPSAGSSPTVPEATPAPVAASADAPSTPSDSTPASPPPAKEAPGDDKSADADESEAKEVVPTEQQINAEAEAQAKRDEAIQKLVDAKQYFLPINAVEKRRSKHFVILGVVLSILLLLAWGDIALDAGLVQSSGVKPLTHFFSN